MLASSGNNHLIPKAEETTVKTIMMTISALTAALALPLCHAGVPEQTTTGLYVQKHADAAGISGPTVTTRLMLAKNDKGELTEQEKLEKKKKEDAERAQKAEKEKAKIDRKAAEKKEKIDRKAAKDKEKADRKAAKDKPTNIHQERKERFISKRNKDGSGKKDPQVAAPATTPAVVAPAAAVAAPAAAAAPKQASAPAASSSPLVVKTYPASGVWYAGATLNGYTTIPGKTGRAWFEWGNSPSFGQATAATAFNGEQSVGQAMRVPTRGKYYYRMVAESSGHLVRGETLTFDAK